MEEEEYAMATAVLVPSDYARGEFLREGFDESHLIQHRYGFDIRRFPERPSEAPADRPFRAVFVGRGDPTKGLHIALEAWRIAALDTAELLIAGRLQPDYEAVLRTGLSLPGVRALGFVTDVASLFADADVLVLPSWTEGSALVIMEAEASGCVPLVSTASGPIGTAGEDFLEHPVGDAAALAAQLTELATQPARLSALSRHGTSRREFLSWDRAAESLRDCYSAVIDAASESA
jgi:glycosyltransferase involved in cell wall biosynthesis